MLRFSIAVSTLFVACATKTSGLDSESHFACNSDADCAVHAGLSVCVEHVCEPPNASTSLSDASLGTGGRSTMNTAGGGAVNMTGGAGGRGDAGTGGRSSTTPDATSPGTPDAGICQKCFSDLAPQQSLDCYCRSHVCDADLAAALVNPKWARFDAGCGGFLIRSDLSRPDGQLEGFDASGRLVAAESWNLVSDSDASGSRCLTPNDDPQGWALGGMAPASPNSKTPFEYTCPPSSTTVCALNEPTDAGLERCNLDALLGKSGVDAGSLCRAGEVRASVCTSCLAGCAEREDKCVRTCESDAECIAAHATGTCVDNICQEFCPF
jgi:hypothetical protein